MHTISSNRRIGHKKTMHIYVQNLSTLSLYVILIFLAFTALLYITRNHVALTKCVATILLIIAIYGIFSYTVLSRTPSNNHAFVFAASKGSEFYREMFMNALLFFPLGLTLTALIGPWSILTAFILCLCIESWQYLAGTGLAQGTDVIMNTLGATIGALPWIIVKCITAPRARRFGSCK